MGYQESLLKVKKIHQDKFIREMSQSFVNESEELVYPKYIIEFKYDKKIYDSYNNRTIKIEKGDKLIYLSGERYQQSSMSEFIYGKEEIFTSVSEKDFEYEFIDIEECLDFVENYLSYYFRKINNNNPCMENKLLKITKYEYYMKNL